MENNKTTIDKSSSLNKKIRKVVEEVILQYQEYFTDIFSEEEILDVLKHKSQIGKLAVDDKQIEEIIKNEVEDCIGAYLIKKGKKRDKKR